MRFTKLKTSSSWSNIFGCSLVSIYRLPTAHNRYTFYIVSECEHLHDHDMGCLSRHFHKSDKVEWDTIPLFALHTNYLITPHSEQWNGMNLPFKPNSGYSEYLNFHICFECVYRNEWFFHLPQISFNFPFLFRIVRFSIRPKLDWKSWANPYVERYGSKWEENSI